MKGNKVPLSQSICITWKDQQTEQTWKEDIPVKISVIVQSSSKAFLLKLAGVVLDIFFRQPRG